MQGFNGIVHGDGGELIHLPLEEVSAKVFICDVTARVLLTQRYVNNAPSATARAKYVFPVPSRAAVCAFELTHADGRVIVGEAKEKTKAADEHAEALKEGRVTALVEWATDDVFTISIGSIPARESVTTKLVYVLDLMEDEHPNQIRFQLPMALGERYGAPPAALVDAALPGARSRLRIAADIQMPGRILSVSSPTHTLGPLIPRKTQTGRNSSRRISAAFRSSSFLRRDFVLVIEAHGLDAPRCVAERDDRLGTIAMQLTLVPKFELPPVPPQEYIFVVDRSGSMAGERIRTAKRTIKILLRMLPNAEEGPGRTTMFNIWSFGDMADSLFAGGSRGYTGATLDMATSHVEGMDADYGGTQIRSALAFALGSRDPTMPTVVFVLTDGETYDIQETVNIVSTCVRNSTRSAPLRVFTLGIGETVSSAMCEGIARAGNGVCLFASSTEKIVGKCARLLRAGRKGILEDVTLDWGFGSQAVAGLVHYEQIPQQIKHIDPGSRLNIILVARMPHRSRNRTPKEVTLRGRLNGVSLDSATLEHIIPVDIVKPFSPDSAYIPLLHTMAARRLITEYEDGRDPGPMFTRLLTEPTGDLKAKVTVLVGEQYQLASKYTSFVAVEGASVRAPARRELDTSQRRSSRHESGTADSIAEPSSLGTIADAAFAIAGWLAGGIGAAFKFLGTDSDRLPRRRRARVPGAFDDSRNTSTSRASAGSVGSRSTMSSLDGSQSDWASSRTPSPSPPPSVDADADYIRSASPILQEQSLPPKRQEQARPPISSAVIDLVQLQAYDGSFDLSDALGEIVGKENMGRAAEFGVDEKAWATALAVAFLKKYLVREPDLLEGLLDKVIEFVRGDAGFDVLLARAGALVF
ncbi:hypothetical protein HWV62_40904 [Athelia sp. TMB]|nr:hypothetical protein HWV62_40904 [Athelia sp. TMB]